MSKFYDAAVRFMKDEGGASLVEYTILIGLITIATITLILSVGGKITGIWTQLDSIMPTGTTSGGTTTGGTTTGGTTTGG